MSRESMAFDIRLQDRTVLESLDVRTEADVASKTLIKEFTEVAVSGALSIELVPQEQSSGTRPLPQLCAIEVLRTGASEIREAGD